jgi:hypothetical protein
MKKILIIGLFLLSGCGYAGDDLRKIFKESGETKVITDNITYTKDSTTNLCFAVIKFSLNGSGRYGYSMTCVPCDSIKNKLQ